MRLVERAAAAAAAIGSINVAPNFQLVSQDAKLNNQSAAANIQQGPPPPSNSIILSAFVGSYAGNGFNTIFRPQGTGQFHTTFNKTVNTGGLPNDNVLELNLMNETLSFTRPDALAAVPNRGFNAQSDIALVGIPYLQVIDDVSNTFTGQADGTPSGIHFEPGLWMVVPPDTSNPGLNQTLNRMGSIPHGTTINAQAFEPGSSIPRAPTFPRVDITPFSISGGPSARISGFTSLNASTTDSSRLPQDLTKFIQAGTITQAILNDTNTILRNSIAGQKISSTTTFTVSTFNQNIVGGGTANQAFLVGANAGPNAVAVNMSATFWIETVQWTVTVPVSKQGQTLTLSPVAPNPLVQLPTFQVTPPRNINAPVNITVAGTQIQYSQLVILNFGPLSWPHSSVNTLNPIAPIVAPASAFN